MMSFQKGLVHQQREFGNKSALGRSKAIAEVEAKGMTLVSPTQMLKNLSAP
jgi:hypothetical protein